MRQRSGSLSKVIMWVGTLGSAGKSTQTSSSEGVDFVGAGHIPLSCLQARLHPGAHVPCPALRLSHLLLALLLLPAAASFSGSFWLMRPFMPALLRQTASSQQSQPRSQGELWGAGLGPGITSGARLLGVRPPEPHGGLNQMKEEPVSRGTGPLWLPSGSVRGRGCESSAACHVGEWRLLNRPAAAFVPARTVGGSHLQKLGFWTAFGFFSLRYFTFIRMCPTAVSGMF